MFDIDNRTVPEQCRDDIKKKIKEELENNKEHIAHIALDHLDYVERVGVVRGLNTALEIIEEITETYFPKRS